MSAMREALAALWHRGRGNTGAILLDAEPEAALLSSVAALRRLGARITRYDTEAGTLEAHVPGGGLVRLRTAADGDRATVVHVESRGAAPGLVRRFRGALSGTSS